MKLSDIKNKTRKITFNFSDEGSLEIEYRIHVITPAFLKANLELSEQLTQAIVSWDLLDDSGNPLEITQEVMDSLPIALQSEINQAIVSDMRIASDEAKKV